MNKLYRFSWDCGRGGDVEGVFAAEESAINDAMGKQVYFGEILGKHSEVYGTLEADDLTALTDDQDFIAKFQAIVGKVGYNPLDYINRE